MTNSSFLGLLVLVGSSIILAAYALALAYVTIIVLQLTAFVSALTIFAMFAWIGYTMLTAPAAPEAGKAIELDDLRAETINPLGQNRKGMRQARTSRITDADVKKGMAPTDAGAPALKKTHTIGVVIPVYGESDSLCWVLRRFRADSVNTICLVVDVPLKRDMQKIREAASEIGVRVRIIKNKDRMGVGYSLRQGFSYLVESGHQIFVGMAGNGKDDSVEVDRVTEPVLSGECDYVQGSRYLPGGKSAKMPFVRIVFNRLYPVIWTLLTQKRCTDVTNGFRCYRLDLLRDPRINLDQPWLNGYALEYYLHYKVLTLGYRVKEVPVSKTYPFGTRGGYSKIQPLKDWWPIVSPLILLFLGVRK